MGRMGTSVLLLVVCALGLAGAQLCPEVGYFTLPPYPPSFRTLCSQLFLQKLPKRVGSGGRLLQCLKRVRAMFIEE